MSNLSGKLYFNSHADITVKGIGTVSIPFSDFWSITRELEIDVDPDQEEMSEDTAYQVLNHFFTNNLLKSEIYRMNDNGYLTDKRFVQLDIIGNAFRHTPPDDYKPLKEQYLIRTLRDSLQ